MQTKKTQQDGSWTYSLQAHPPQQFKHPQHQFSSSIIKWRFQTTWMKTTHMASKGCIAFLPSLTFTTAQMCKFTIILAEAVKLCLKNISRKFLIVAFHNSFRTTRTGFDSFWQTCDMSWNEVNRKLSVYCNIQFFLTKYIWEDLSNRGGVFNKTIISRARVGYEMIIANLALCASLAIYHLISNARSWNNC